MSYQENEDFLQGIQQENKELKILLDRAMRGLVLTQDYTLLPRIEGWEWFDSCEEISKDYPDLKWSKEYQMRIEQLKND